MQLAGSAYKIIIINSISIKHEKSNEACSQTDWIETGHEAETLQIFVGSVEDLYTGPIAI